MWSFQLSSCLPHSFLAVKSGEIQAFDLASGIRIPNGVISKKDYFEENEIFFHPGKFYLESVSIWKLVDPGRLREFLIVESCSKVP